MINKQPEGEEGREKTQGVRVFIAEGLYQLLRKIAAVRQP